MSQRGHGPRPASRRRSSSISPIGTQLSAVQFTPRHESRNMRYELPGIASPDIHQSSQQEHQHQHQHHHHYHHHQRQHSQHQPQHQQAQQSHQHQHQQPHQQHQHQHHQHHHQQSHSSKALGVHNILNPSEPLSMASEAGGRPSSRSRADAEGAASVSASSSTVYGSTSSRSHYPGHVSTHSLPATPVAAGVSPFGRPPMSEHSSPVASYHPFSSSFSNPNRTLSPRPPRALSISHPPPHRSSDARQQPPALVPASSPAKRPYEVDTPDEPRPPPGLHHPPSMASIGHAPLVTPPRSISQPLGRHIDGRHVTPPSLPTPGDLQGRSHVLPSPVQLQGLSAAPPGPPLSAMPRLESPTTEASPAWPEMLRRQGFSGVEPQQAFMTLPGSDTPIPVQVDYSQASKKADEKRQRNAKASTRHRRKKKTLQEENMKQLQELKDERSQMLQQMEDLMHQRNFYRDERNRLKDLVLHTPAISKHAAGPPSPVSTKSVGSIGDRSPASGHQHIPTPTQGYSSEASSVDHPPPPSSSQRRRADERLERLDYAAQGQGYAVPSGSMQQQQQQHGLPPVQGQAYGVLPSRMSPIAASAGLGERLPPLRAMEAHHPPVSGPGPGLALSSSSASSAAGLRQEQDLRTGQWRAAQATHYETGWATAPRKPYDGHQW